MSTISQGPSMPENNFDMEMNLTPIKQLTYGGFPALTWKEYRRDLSNFTPKCKYARDLPHSFQDHVNRMSPQTRMMPQMRIVFEAMISQNTFEDEASAPRISLENNVDDDPTPLWEFHYTNELWHGEGVPPPDIRNLVNCGCRSGCNPKSKTCACIRRQEKAAEYSATGFAFDKARRLKINQYPIFECNSLCACGPECQNRVVQQGRKIQVVIKKTKQKGWGVFAGRKKIPSGTFIGIFSGELLTEKEACKRELQYGKVGRLCLFDLDFHHQKVGNPDWKNQFTIDVFRAGNFTRFLPNATLHACYINECNVQKPLLTVFSSRDISAGEEICINYAGNCGEDTGKELYGRSESNDQKDEVNLICLCGAQNCQSFIFRPPYS